MNCPFCNQVMRHEMRDEVVDYLTPEGVIRVPVATPYEVCDRDGFAGFGEAGETARTAAIRAAVGRAVP